MQQNRKLHAADTENTLFIQHRGRSVLHLSFSSRAPHPHEKTQVSAALALSTSFLLFKSSIKALRFVSFKREKNPQTCNLRYHHIPMKLIKLFPF